MTRLPFRTEGTTLGEMNWRDRRMKLFRRCARHYLGNGQGGTRIVERAVPSVLHELPIMRRDHIYNGEGQGSTEI